MEPLNFCRQMLKSFSEEPGTNSKQEIAHATSLCKLSKKFCLPKGGFYEIDPEFRALRGSKLSLPFEYTAIEWLTTANEHYNSENCKTIGFIRQTDESMLFSFAYYIDRSEERQSGYEYKDYWLYEFYEYEVSRVDFLTRDTPDSSQSRFRFKVHSTQQELIDSNQEMNVAMSFINILSCSNVRAERRDHKRVKRLKNALPFDDYHFLTIDCPKRHSPATGHHIDERRHPREHLRRGHIRRLENGNRIWVNSTIVNAGVGGKISKDYGVRDPRAKMIEALS